MTKNFSVNWRNPGHWDIYIGDARRYIIRGKSGSVIVENTKPETSYLPYLCESVSQAMTFICGQLMKEDPVEDKGKDVIDIYEVERNMRKIMEGLLKGKDPIVEKGVNESGVRAAEAGKRLRKVMERMIDDNEFLSDKAISNLLNDAIDKRIKEWMENNDNRLKR